MTRAPHAGGAHTVPRLSSTAQYLRHFARAQPDAAAVVEGNASASYRDLATRVIQLTRALEELGVAQGMLAGIECQDRMLHLLAILACEIIGAASVSLTAFDLRAGSRIALRCDFVLASRRCELAAPRMQVITDDWIAKVFSRALGADDWACLERAPGPADIVRIARTSGTTQEPKCLANSHHVQSRFIANLMSGIADERLFPLQYLCWRNFTVRGAHLRSRMALHSGGTIVLTALDKVFEDTARFETTYATALPIDVEQIVRTAPPAFRKPPGCHVDVLGGVLTDELRGTLTELLASEISYSYSTNETGHIAFIAADGIGTLVADCEARIVDDEGRAKPYGEVGVIEVRTGSMVEGYLDDDVLTGACFRNGWFHTNDLGRMPEPGKLAILGRADSVLNVGGYKLLVPPLEEEIKSILGITDAALFCVADESGIGRIATAVELDPSLDRQAITARLRATLPSHIGAAHAVFMRKFPRTDSGKLKRGELEAQVRAALAAAGSKPRGEGSL